MLEYLECDEDMRVSPTNMGRGGGGCGLRRAASLQRKLSDMGAAAVSITSSPSSSSTSMPKPCLKRRSSVPARPSEAAAEVGLRHCRGGSCDSLGSSSTDLDHLVDSAASSSEAGSFASRKSVSFADSVGEDLCHIKVFMKEQHELDLQELNWHHRMWRWQSGYSSVGTGTSSSSSGGDWYFGEEEEEEEYEEEEEDELEYYGGCFGFDAIHEVDIEEEEEEEEDDSIYMGRRLPNYEDPIEEEEEEEEDKDTPPPSTSMVTSTFLCPSDLPDYQDILRERGICLESVAVVGGGDAGAQTLISGTLALHPSVVSSSASSSSPLVSVRYSTDGWATERRAAAAAFRAGERYGFVLDASALTVGDDLELAAVCELNHGSGEKRVFEDGNGGANYRFICKNRPRFQPGKKLW